MPRFVIKHITKYTYPEPVTDSANQIMLFPLKSDNQDVLQQKINITGEPVLEVFKDYYGNETGTFSNIAPHTQLIIESMITVVTRPVQLPEDDVDVKLQWEHLQNISGMVPFIDFLKQENFEALGEVKKIADNGFYKTVTVYTAVLQLNEFVYKNFKYITGITSVETTLDEIWKLRAGVCQDFAHMLLVMLRLLDIPARYVSGYVCPRNKSLRGDGATHAWVEAYIPFYGWLGIDPTNNCIVSDLHVRLAIGRSFSDCSPVKGSYKGTARQTLEVSVTVVHEDGQPAKHHEPVFVNQPITKPIVSDDEGNTNSFRKYMQMVQQQQQQQQQ